MYILSRATYSHQLNSVFNCFWIRAVDKAGNESTFAQPTGTTQPCLPGVEAPDVFTLAFPLDILTPYTATISAVFDHSNLNGFNCPDGIVTAYTNEEGIRSEGVSNSSVTVIEGVCAGQLLFGFKNDTNTEILGVQRLKNSKNSFS